MLLYINWDGFSASWYRMAHASPLGTPNLDNLIAQGTVLLQQRCGIPAITNPMQQALISGAWPEKTGNCYCYFGQSGAPHCEDRQIESVRNHCRGGSPPRADLRVHTRLVC